MWSYNDWLYCSVCGARLVQVETNEGYDRRTGQKLRVKRMKCPNSTPEHFHDSYIIPDNPYYYSGTSPIKTTWQKFVDNFFNEL